MKKYAILGAVILILGFLINYSLGGFNGLDAKLVKVNNYTVYGKSFEGSYKSEQLAKIIDEMRDYQLAIDNPSNLVIINYINEAKETIGKIDNFVGLEFASSKDANILESFEERVIIAQKAIRIEVKISPLVMPSPEKINMMALIFAEEKGLTLQGISLEQYTNDGILVIEYPVDVKN